MKTIPKYLQIDNLILAKKKVTLPVFLLNSFLKLICE